MFGDTEGLERITITEVEKKSGVKDGFIEVRSESENWYITYFVYEDHVEVVEAMGDNYEHCKAEAETLEEAAAIAGKWC